MENNQLYEKIAKLERLLKRRQMHSGNKMHMDPSWGQGRVLAALTMKDGISTKELSYVLDIAPPSLNEMLAKLVKAGFVERRASEEDKRIILNYVTEAGKNANTQQNDEDAIPFLDCLTGEEQQILEGYLDRIIARLEEAIAERQGNGEAQEPEMPGKWGRPQKGRGSKQRHPPQKGHRGMHPPMPDFPGEGPEHGEGKPSFMDRFRQPRGSKEE